METLRENGAPLDVQRKIEVLPNKKIFPWGSYQSNSGLNFIVTGAPLDDIAECSDAEGRLSWFTGLINPRLYPTGDPSKPPAFAHSMVVSNIGFEHDVESLEKIDRAGQEANGEFSKVGHIEKFVVGKANVATLIFYRSPASSTVIALCISDPQAARGQRCNAIANTEVAGYQIDVDSMIWQKESRLECVLKALSWLEKETKVTQRNE